MIRRLRDAFGAERLMWATDCPYQVQTGTPIATRSSWSAAGSIFSPPTIASGCCARRPQRVFFS